MKRKKLLTTTLFLALTITTAHGQALKVTPDMINMRSTTTIYDLGAGDGLGIITKNSTKVLNSGSDLLWGTFYQEQPNNPGLLSLTSSASPAGWSPCFTVRANGNTGIFNANPSVALEVGSASSIQQVKVNGNIVWASDARMKDNIKNLSNSLGRLKNLRGVSYNLKEEEREDIIPEKFLKDSTFQIEKAKGRLRKAPKKANTLLSREFYGFLAQDVQTLFPDLVYTDDSTGLLSVDYIGLIPLLVDGLKEQQNQIEQQQAQIDEQKEQIASILKVLGKGTTNDPLGKDIESIPLLHQNTPNPFNQSTEIGFYIPGEVQAAHLYIYDINGFQKKSYPIQTRENGSVTIDASTLNAGTYFYTLICDSKPVDTKQLILIK